MLFKKELKKDIKGEVMEKKLQMSNFILLIGIIMGSIGIGLWINDWVHNQEKNR